MKDTVVFTGVRRDTQNYRERNPRGDSLLLTVATGSSGKQERKQHKRIQPSEGTQAPHPISSGPPRRGEGEGWMGPGLIPACASSSPAFFMMYSACKLNKQGDNTKR